MELIKKERKIAINAIEEKVKITRQLTNNINHEIKPRSASSEATSNQS